MTGTPSAAGSPARPRSTRQRTAVADLLDELDGFRSAQEVHAVLRGRGDGIGLTTVYRALQAFAESGEVDVLVGDDGEARYRRCSRGHHHHLVCRSCGLTVEVEGPTVEAWAARTASEHGFDQVSHTIEIFGRCASCAGHADG